MLINPETLPSQLPLNEIFSAVSHSVDETLDIAGNSASWFQLPGIVFLNGDLGSGKTYFTKGIARYFGIDQDSVCSPTFVLMREHHAERVDLYHIDLYRINNSMSEIHYLDFFNDITAQSVFVIEWAPERTEIDLQAFRTLFSSAFSVSISRNDDESRNIGIEKLF